MEILPFVCVNIRVMSNIVHILKTRDSQKHAAFASAILKRGHIIALPTDTVYGVAALAQENNAVSKIYEIKQRSCLKPIAICVADVNDIYKWGQVTVDKALLCALLPGPVTLVFKRTASLNPLLNPETNLVGIRIPDNLFIRKIAEKCASPLALTSANVSGEKSPLTVQEFKTLWPFFKRVYNAGQLGTDSCSREGSTVVDLSNFGMFKIIRKGNAYGSTVSILQKHGLKVLE